MKKLLLVVFFFTSVIGLRAQSWVYHPFPIDSAIWMEEHVGSDGYYTYKRIYMLGDTLVGSLNYKKIYQTYATWTSFYPTPIGPSNYIGSLREDIPTKKIYFLNPGTTSENLLYDFDLVVGDTIAITSMCSPDDTVMVVSIDSVLVNGNYNKKFVLGSVSGFCTAGDLIEGVGSKAGLQQLYSLGFEFSNQLLCLSVSNSVVYPYGSSIPSYYCAYAVGIGELENNELKMTVMPNPVVNAIHIVVNCSDNYDIEIRNGLGELIHKKTDLQANGPTIDFSDFATGIYFVRLIDSKGNSIVKKVIKN